MAARHRARSGSIQIMKVAIVPANKCRRLHVTNLHVSNKSHTSWGVVFKLLCLVNWYNPQYFFTDRTLKSVSLCLTVCSRVISNPSLWPRGRTHSTERALARWLEVFSGLNSTSIDAWQLCMFWDHKNSYNIRKNWCGDYDDESQHDIWKL